MQALTGKRELGRWLDLTDRLYAGTPGFIPPLRQQIRDFFAGKAPYFRHGGSSSSPWCATATSSARTTAHTNSKLDAKLGAKHLLFGFTEFVEDDEVFAALVAALEARARASAPSACSGPSTCCRTSREE